MIKPEIGKVYWVLLPGREDCIAQSVVELTERTVVLGKTNYFTEELCKHTSEHWIRVAKEDTRRYPLRAIEFVEEAQQSQL